MVRRAGTFGLALALLAGCTEKITLDDVWNDGGPDVGAAKDGQVVLDDAGCKQTYVPLNYEPRSAQLLVLLDRSTDMQTAFAGTTREAAAQTALLKAIATYQMRVKFGFEYFPADGTGAPCPTGTCCAGPVSVDPTLSNLAAMTSGIQCGPPHGAGCPPASSDSPSYAALAAARDYYKSDFSNSYGDRYVLLVTSSDPSCAADAHDPCDYAKTAASNLGNLGIHMAVLIVGRQPGETPCLSKVSQYGSAALPQYTSPLYAANSTTELDNDLIEFFSAAASTACTLDTTASVPDQTQLTVSIGLNFVPQVDRTNLDGWSFVNFAHTIIAFSGSACDQFVNSTLLQPDVGYSCSSCDSHNTCGPLGP